MAHAATHSGLFISCLPLGSPQRLAPKVRSLCSGVFYTIPVYSSIVSTSQSFQDTLFKNPRSSEPLTQATEPSKPSFHHYLQAWFNILWEENAFYFLLEMTWEKKRSTNITQKYKVASKFCSRYILLNVTYLELKLKAISTLYREGIR